MSKKSFRVISNQEFRVINEGIDFEFCIIDIDFKDVEKTLYSIENLLNFKNQFVVSIIDIFNYFKDEKKSNTLLKKFPYLSIYSFENNPIVDALNLYNSYIKSRYVVYLDAISMVERFDVEKIIERFEENKYLLGMTPKIVDNEKIIDNVFRINDNKELFRLDYQKFRKTILPYEWIWIVHKERYDLFEDLDSRYDHFMVTSLDMGYRIMEDNYCIECSDLMELKRKDVEKIDDIDRDKFKKDLYFFYFKNIKKFLWSINSVIKIFYLLLTDFYRYNSFCCSRKKKPFNTRLNTDVDIVRKINTDHGR